MFDSQHHCKNVANACTRVPICSVLFTRIFWIDSERVESIFYCWLKIPYDLRMFTDWGLYVAYFQPDAILLNRKRSFERCVSSFIFFFCFYSKHISFSKRSLSSLTFFDSIFAKLNFGFLLSFWFINCSMIFYNVNNFIWMNILLIHLHIQLYPIHLCSNLSNKYWWEILKQKQKLSFLIQNKFKL